VLECSLEGWGLRLYPLGKRPAPFSTSELQDGQVMEAGGGALVGNE